MLGNGWYSWRGIWPVVLLIALILAAALAGIAAGLASLPPEERGGRVLTLLVGIGAGAIVAGLSALRRP